MDNRYVKVTSVGAAALEKALSLLEKNYATGYKIDKDQKRMIVYWSHVDNPSYVAFPFKCDIPQLTQFIISWLNEVGYGPQPDHDGHNKKGWTCYCEDWGHVNKEWQAFAGIEPEWAMYGK